jgi:hypothetical protein
MLLTATYMAGGFSFINRTFLCKPSPDPGGGNGMHFCVATQLRGSGSDFDLSSAFAGFGVKENR